MIVVPFDLEEDSTRGFVLKKAIMDYTCFSCYGTGVVRANRQTEKGYQFRKETCSCCNGSRLFKSKV